jgi:hypothetical protein
MTQILRVLSAIGFACFLALGFAGSAQASQAGGVSKAIYSSTDGSLLQLASQKPCCYNPHYGNYARSTPKTCRKYGGYVVQEQYCGGYGYGYPVQPGHPGWGGGYQGGQTVCCKRKRRDWWSPNAYTCRQQGGYVAHHSHCYNG